MDTQPMARRGDARRLFSFSTLPEILVTGQCFPIFLMMIKKKSTVFVQVLVVDETGLVVQCDALSRTQIILSPSNVECLTVEFAEPHKNIRIAFVSQTRIEFSEPFTVVGAKMSKKWEPWHGLVDAPTPEYRKLAPEFHCFEDNWPRIRDWWGETQWGGTPHNPPDLEHPEKK